MTPYHVVVLVILAFALGFAVGRMTTPTAADPPDDDHVSRECVNNYLYGGRR